MAVPILFTKASTSKACRNWSFTDSRKQQTKQPHPFLQSSPTASQPFRPKACFRLCDDSLPQNCRVAACLTAACHAERSEVESKHLARNIMRATRDDSLPRKNTNHHEGHREPRRKAISNRILVRTSCCFVSFVVKYSVFCPLKPVFSPKSPI